MFDICMLSPFSGIVEHTVKRFNRFEEIGYIESQVLYTKDLIYEQKKNEPTKLIAWVLNN